MKHTLQQVFRSGKFVVGFSIFMVILLIVIIYPLIVTRSSPGHHRSGYFLRTRDLCECL
jgi:hypothetical protein